MLGGGTRLERASIHGMRSHSNHPDHETHERDNETKDSLRLGEAEPNATTAVSVMRPGPAEPTAEHHQGYACQRQVPREELEWAFPT